MLLIQRKQITEAQLANTLREHLITDKKLGDILVDKGLVPRSVVDYYTLEQHRLRKLFDDRDSFYKESSRLGDLLEITDLVSAEQIRDALDEQKRTGKQLGDILVQRGYISRDTLEEVLSLQARFRRTAISAMLSLVTSLVAIPHVNSANLSSATGQISITLRFTDERRPVFLQIPDQFDRNDNLDISLDAAGELHKLALSLDDTNLILEVDSDKRVETNIRDRNDTSPLKLDDYELEFKLEEAGTQGETMNISLSPT
jgi:hypothetical protein